MHDLGAEAEEGDQREEPEPEQVGHLHLRQVLQRHDDDCAHLQRNSIFSCSGLSFVEHWKQDIKNEINERKTFHPTHSQREIESEKSCLNCDLECRKTKKRKEIVQKCIL